jgi:hypothetical protein
MVLWLYGYLVTGNPSLIDWRAYTPWWIADLLHRIRNRNDARLRWLGVGLLASSQ